MSAGPEFGELIGRLLEKYGKHRYYLQRWPSRRSMKRVRARVKERTGRKRCGKVRHCPLPRSGARLGRSPGAEVFAGAQRPV